jgi:hypothetical protein
MSADADSLLKVVAHLERVLRRIDRQNQGVRQPQEHQSEDSRRVRVLVEARVGEPVQSSARSRKEKARLTFPAR